MRPACTCGEALKIAFNAAASLPNQFALGNASRMRALPLFAWVILAFVSLPARAHFRLDSPSSWAEQGSYGDPQKSAPCGQADPGLNAIATGAVTAEKQGSVIAITFEETI